MRAYYGKGVSLVMAGIFAPPLYWALDSLIPILGVYMLAVLGLVGCTLLLVIPLTISESLRQRGREKRRAESATRKKEASGP